MRHSYSPWVRMLGLKTVTSTGMVLALSASGAGTWYWLLVLTLVLNAGTGTGERHAQARSFNYLRSGHLATLAHESCAMCTKVVMAGCCAVLSQNSLTMAPNLFEIWFRCKLLHKAALQAGRSESQCQMNT